MFTAIYIKTNNDVNGNPRRGWLVRDDIRDIGFIDEGYGGSRALLTALQLNNYGQVDIVATLDVTPGEYRNRFHGPRTKVDAVPGTRLDDSGNLIRPGDDNAGTWLDGARGWTISAEVIRIAWRFGMPHSDWDESIVTAYERNEEWVTLGAYGVREKIDVPGAIINQGGMVDTAESWLNDHVAAEGYWFGSAPDGDGWGYWPWETEIDGYLDPAPGVPNMVAPNAGSTE